MYSFVPNKTQIFPSPVKGIVEKEIFGNQSGSIKYDGSFWRAKLHQTDDIKNIPVGQTVSVIGREGNTLLVIPN